MKSFYVYEHWRPDKDVCFYVGKGRGDRAHDFKWRRRNKHHKAICKKLTRLSMCVEIRMVASGLSEDAAFALEVERITFWRSLGIRLANKTSGGEGRSGAIVSKKRLQQISEQSTLYWSNPENRERQRQLMVGQTRSEEIKEKFSIAQKKRFQSPEALAQITEHCRKLAADRVGKPGRPLAGWEIEALRTRRTGIKASPETLAKMSAAKLGKPRNPFTQETIEKMRAAASKREAEKRASRARS